MAINPFRNPKLFLEKFFCIDWSKELLQIDDPSYTPDRSKASLLKKSVSFYIKREIEYLQCYLNHLNAQAIEVRETIFVPDPDTFDFDLTSDEIQGYVENEVENNKQMMAFLHDKLEMLQSLQKTLGDASLSDAALNYSPYTKWFDKILSDFEHAIGKIVTLDKLLGVQVYLNHAILKYQRTMEALERYQELFKGFEPSTRPLVTVLPALTKHADAKEKHEGAMNGTHYATKLKGACQELLTQWHTFEARTQLLAETVQTKINTEKQKAVVAACKV